MTRGSYAGGSADSAGDNPFGADPFGGDPASASRPGESWSQAPGSREQEANTLATLSVVFAFAFAPAGVVLGHLALSQIRDSAERGRDRALVGVTLSYVFITAALVALVVVAAGVPAR